MSGTGEKMWVPPVICGHHGDCCVQGQSADDSGERMCTSTKEHYNSWTKKSSSQIIQTLEDVDFGGWRDESGEGGW